MRVRQTAAIGFIVFFINMTACAVLDPSSYGPGAFIIDGTVHHLEIEGGCWQFVSDDDISYELVGLDILTHLQNGANARLIVRSVKGAATICMVGKIVEVLEIVHQSSL